MDGHALIVAIEPGSLLSREGVEDGDILDELCGEQVLEDTHGRVGVATLTVPSQHICRAERACSHLCDCLHCSYS